MRIRKKVVNGHEYYYLEESIRLEKPKVYSVFLGRRIPNANALTKYREKLAGKVYSDLLGSQFIIYLKKSQLVAVEKRRRRYEKKILGLSKASLDEKEETDSVNFVYTTLTTEGIPMTMQDASLAYKFDQKNVRNVRDENLRIALDMIKGLRLVKESKPGLSLEFLLKLHGMIMSGYSEKSPGKFRVKQAFIYLKSFEKVEEIGFRPIPAEKITEKLDGLVQWYNQSVGKLNAIELAALLHLRFYVIHPFEDGNKRTARLLLNKAFFDSNYPMQNISSDTQGYFDSLIKSVETKEEKPFVDFVYRTFLKSI